MFTQKIYSFFINFVFSVTSCDAAEPWQIGIQDPATPIMEGMLRFHNFLVFCIIFIGVAVCWLLYYIVLNFNENSNKKVYKFTHHNALEVIWTIIPAYILVHIAVPSFALLYSLDELIDPQVTLKIVGHQWYWSYEFSDYQLLNDSNNTDTDIDVKPILNFDCYMQSTEDLTKGFFRLLETENRVFLPTNTHIRLLITSADVLHSWAVPSFGIKIDACPGRLSQASLFIKRPGLFYGQCSEICGVNHAFMPIVIKSVEPNVFVRWITYMLNK